MNCDEASGPTGCHELMMERIRYFTGRHMTARDFHDADAYHRSFRQLHNRVLHGAGIACGLEVEEHWNPDCRRDRVIVRCGLAIDCCGREVLVPRNVVTAPIPWKERPNVSGSERPDERYVLVLCLKYRECRTEKVPVLYSATACSSPSYEEGRIREGYELTWLWVLGDEIRDYGWDDPRGCPPPKEEPEPYGESTRHKPETPDEPSCEDDDPAGCCLEPKCRHGHCVLLAVFRAKRREEMSGREAIDIGGRRTLSQAREHLTHICWINWPHGGRVRASALKNLQVRFDRELLAEVQPKGYPGPRGINERTFVVQFGEQSDRRQIEDLDFVAYRRPPYLAHDRRTAVYEFDRGFRSYRDHVIHVTLRCDFIVDCRRHPVDGNHLGGRLPTGDGAPGGTFESWFVVVDDADYERTADTEQRPPNEGTQEYKP
jgi:hypothetical protein